MHVALNEIEGAALHGLLNESAGDIVFKLDRAGFIEHASRNIADIGFDLPSMLVKPHISDLAQSDYVGEVSTYTKRILGQMACVDASPDWVEFPVCLASEQMGEAPARTWAWYELSLRAIAEPDGETVGALGLLRSVDRLRALEGEVYSRALIDPLTGLANRHAFSATLRRYLATGAPATMALFEVERMRAIFMQYGQRTADEIIWGFAKFLEAMSDPEHELAQFDGERFCLILPGDPSGGAQEWVRDVIETFSTLALTQSGAAPKLSAIVGLAAIEHSVDWTLRQAELALVMARAHGGMQVAFSPGSLVPLRRLSA